jgi:hypothetical protein
MLCDRIEKRFLGDFLEIHVQGQEDLSTSPRTLDGDLIPRNRGTNIVTCDDPSSGRSAQPSFELTLDTTPALIVQDHSEYASCEISVRVVALKDAIDVDPGCAVQPIAHTRRVQSCGVPTSSGARQPQGPGCRDAQHVYEQSPYGLDITHFSRGYIYEVALSRYGKRRPFAI